MSVAAAADSLANQSEAIPEYIGEYRVIGELGTGGMGVVYEAEQDQPRRRVALKMIRPGLVDHKALRRFRSEAELFGQLHDAHHRGVVHRDLKPGNILVEGGERPVARVLDFGIARLRGRHALTITEPGQIIGTLRYMSPEQALGDVARGRDGEHDPVL